MKLQDLDFNYPPERVATEPRRPSRVAWSEPNRQPLELSIDRLLERVGADDLFVINDTKVIPARIFTRDETEILFLKARTPNDWEVLFPARDFKPGATLTLPGNISAVLIAKGLPQILSTSEPLTPEYFELHGEVALPPYIQEARAERHNRPSDANWYQTAWAQNLGSVAAPTASLHFGAEHLERMPNVQRITLHVGAGTFLPVRSDDLRQHVMHPEAVYIPASVEDTLRARRGRVWALGTTVARALESLENLPRTELGRAGTTNLFLYPPYEFKNVDVLLTNFHQPRSTLLALVAAFAGLSRMRETYAWAVAQEFNLFSYGDLSAWTR